MPDFIDDAPTIPTDFFDASGAIAHDHQCKRCGYNLRTLREDGRCPECGTPVGLSIRGDLLRFADPDWGESVAKGLKIILWMILVSIVINLASTWLFPGKSVVGAILGLLTGMVSFYGVWLMTTPDPSGIGEDPNLTARKVVRISLVVGLAGSGAALVGTATGGIPTTAVSTSVAVAGALAALVNLVGEFATFIFYEKLAMRIPDVAIADRARFLKWAFTIALAIVVLGAGLFFVTSLSTAPGGPGAGGSSVGASAPVFGCLAALAGLAFVIFSIMTVFMLLRLRRAVAQQACLARESWAAANITSP